MIKYSYAKNFKNEIVNISSLAKERNAVDGNLFCLSCNERVIAKLGDIRERHFSHYSAACSFETYLHNLGKRLFYQEYLRCCYEKIPFFIYLYQATECDKRKSGYGHSCHKVSIEQFDLTNYFPYIFLEERVGDFIPDILLLSADKKKRIFLEVAVTHLSTEEKRNSQHRIIELKVNSESDLEVIKTHSLDERQVNVTFINFKSTVRKNCAENCCGRFDFFAIDTSGSCRMSVKSLSEIGDILQKEEGNIIDHSISETSENPGLKYLYLVSDAWSRKVPIKNCFLCRYHDLNKENKGKKIPIFCTLFMKVCNSNEAVTCDCFEVYPQHPWSYLDQWNRWNWERGPGIAFTKHRHKGS